MHERNGFTADRDFVELPLLLRLERKAEAGDGSAACQLGDLYREGKVVKQDWKAAFHWYERGSLLGDPKAQNNLGTMFLNGISCQADKQQAIFWYRKSAEQGCATAQWNLAKRYYHGDGIEQDFAEAYDWFGKAAAQGITEASCEMGTMHRFGQGVERNFLVAAKFHLIAAEDGDSVACGNLSEYRSDLESLALSGSQRASFYLHKMYNRGFGVEVSLPLAWTWILCAWKHCSADPDALFAENVNLSYRFQKRRISSEDREGGESALVALRSSWSDQKGHLSTEPMEGQDDDGLPHIPKP